MQFLPTDIASFFSGLNNTSTGRGLLPQTLKNAANGLKQGIESAADGELKQARDEFQSFFREALAAVGEGEIISATTALQGEPEAKTLARGPYSRHSTDGVTYTLDEVCFTKKELLELRRELLKAGAPEEGLKQFDALAGQPDGSTLAQVMAALQQHALGGALSNKDKENIAGLLGKIDPTGVLTEQALTLMEEGKGQQALTLISRVFAAVPDSVEIRSDQLLSLGRGLGLGSEALQRVKNGMSGFEAGLFDSEQFNLLMNPANEQFSADLTRQNKINTALENTLKPVIARARARMEKEKSASALQDRKVEQSKTHIKKTVSRKSRQHLDTALQEGQGGSGGQDAAEQNDMAIHSDGARKKGASGGNLHSSDAVDRKGANNTPPSNPAHKSVVAAPGSERVGMPVKSRLVGMKVESDLGRDLEGKASFKLPDSDITTVRLYRDASGQALQPQAAGPSARAWLDDRLLAQSMLLPAEQKNVPPDLRFDKAARPEKIQGTDRVFATNSDTVPNKPFFTLSRTAESNRLPDAGAVEGVPRKLAADGMAQAASVLNLAGTPSKLQAVVTAAQATGQLAAQVATGAMAASRLETTDKSHFSDNRAQVAEHAPTVQSAPVKTTDFVIGSERKQSSAEDKAGHHGTGDAPSFSDKSDKGSDARRGAAAEDGKEDRRDGQFLRTGKADKSDRPAHAADKFQDMPTAELNPQRLGLSTAPADKFQDMPTAEQPKAQAIEQPKAQTMKTASGAASAPVEQTRRNQDTKPGGPVPVPNEKAAEEPAEQGKTIQTAGQFSQNHTVDNPAARSLPQESGSVSVPLVGEAALPSAAHQVEENMYAALRNGNAGTTRLDLELDPQNLGSISILLTSRNGQVTARIHADKDETAELLTRQVENVRANLEAQGVMVRKIEVQCNTSSSDRESRDHEGGSTQDQHRQDLNQHQAWQEKDSRQEEFARLRVLSNIRNSFTKSENALLEQPVQYHAQTARYADQAIHLVA